MKIQIQIVLPYRADKVGVITRIEKDRLHILNMDGKVQLFPIQSITKRRINRNATALDSQNNNLNVGDIVNVIDGPFGVRISYSLLRFIFALFFLRIVKDKSNIFIVILFLYFVEH